MGALIRLLAVVQFVLVGFGVNFPVDDPLRNLAFGLALLALGGIVPRIVNLPSVPASE